MIELFSLYKDKSYVYSLKKELSFLKEFLDKIEEELVENPENIFILKLKEDILNDIKKLKIEMSLVNKIKKAIDG